MLHQHESMVRRMAEGGGIEQTRQPVDACTLSPMQAGMLYQVLRHDLEGQTAGYDIEQLHLRFAEPLDVERLTRAWAALTRQHALLSVSFDWAHPGAPCQIFHAPLEVPIETRELPGADALQRQAGLDAFLKLDRARGFNLQRPPLHRVTVFVTDRGATEFVWTLHHILLDGRSFSIVLAELLSAYEALRRGTPLEFATRPHSFREFIAWLEQRDHLAARSYFQALLSGKSAPTPLPYSEHTRFRAKGKGYAARSRTLEPQVGRRVRELAEQSQTTTGTVFQAAWAIVLSRFTGDDDVIFGMPRHGRNALDGAARRMVGLFTNTLPVRARLGRSSTVGALLSELRAQSLALRPFEHTPLVEVQAQSGIPQGTPLFPTLLLFENRDLTADIRDESGVGAQLEAVTLHEQPAFPLTVQIYETDHYTVRMIYDEHELYPELVERLFDALTSTLDELTTTERSLDELCRPTATELAKLLIQWNDTARPFPDQQLIHQSFEERVRLQPDAAAVIAGERSLSYLELERRANRLAQALQGRGLAEGAYIGVCLRRGIDLVVALLAVAKTGAAYVPLDHQYPLERLRFMIENSDASLVITESALEDRFAGPTLVLDAPATRDELAAKSSERASLRATAESECYVMYTSGSTGKPKGVVLTHRAVVNTLDWVNRTFQVGPGDRSLFVTSPSFDLSVYDLFGVLGAGATIVVPDELTLSNPDALAAELIQQRITIWNSAPAALQLVLPSLSHRLEQSPDSARQSPVRLMLLSGDWIPLKLVRAAQASYPSARIISLGGATEAAIWSNWYPIDTIEPHWTSVPYGRPIQNSRYYVLDAERRPVPIGTTGELYIGGACVANGYRNRDDLTAERFIADPFSASAGARLYRTGDLVRYYEDGNLEILGRTDQQLKIRGFRVELAEVEAALDDVPGVQNSICTTDVDESGHKSLIGYVVLRAGAVLDEESVKRALARTLPDYMVPSRILFVEALALTPNGKIDRAALPRPSRHSDRPVSVRASTETEREIVRIWERVLRRSPIGAGDNFFELGGHSLLAVQLFNQINRTFSLSIQIGALFEYPTLRALADHIDGLLNDPSRKRPWSSVVPIQPRGSLPPLFYIAGIGGHPFAATALAPALGPEQPLYGLQHRGLSREQVPHLSIADMAREFGEEVRRIQPRGPYYLSGFSAGGVVAYELARQLLEDGERVELLVLLDAFNPALPKWSTTEGLAILLRLTRHYGVRYGVSRVAAFLKFRSAKYRLAWKARDKREFDNLALQIAFDAALDRYSLEPYAGNTLLIRSHAKPCPDVSYRADDSNGWRDWVSGGRLQVVTIDCRHDQLLAERGTDVGETLRVALANARSRRTVG